MSKKNLFCFSGGGLRGLDIHAGFCLALSSANIIPSAVIGTSAGAIIAAFLASNYSAADLTAILVKLKDEDVRQEKFMWKVRIPWIQHFLEHEPIRRLLWHYLPDSFNKLTMPFACVTVRCTDGAQVIFGSEELGGILPSDTCDWRNCVLASTSISGVFPWVKIDHIDYADGGVRSNLPLPNSWKNYDRIILCIASTPQDYTQRGKSMLSRLMLNIDWYAQDQVEDVFAIINNATPPKPEVVVLRLPSLNSDQGCLHFAHELISIANAHASAILSSTQ